jgi:hypothetical protein
MLSAKRQREGQIPPCMPLVLAVQSKVGERNRQIVLQGEGLPRDVKLTNGVAGSTPPWYKASSVWTLSWPMVLDLLGKLLQSIRAKFAPNPNFGLPVVLTTSSEI